MMEGQTALPEAFLSRMEKMLGDRLESFLAACRESRPRALRCNLLKTDREDFLHRNAEREQPFHLTDIPWVREGFSCREEDRPGRHPWHSAGLYYMQEPSAMVPAMLLGTEPGDRVLDLCAAPGGKSTQAAGALQGRGVLVANEISRERCRVLSQNVERMGIANGVVLNCEPRVLAEHFPLWFDRILVDAPCSGEGMFRKEPEALRQWSPQLVEDCAALQRDILEQAAAMLHPGGRLVYSTCTFAPEEDEQMIAGFLHAHADFHLIEPARFAGMEEGHPEWTADRNEELRKTVRLWPDTGAWEGHFAAVLERDGEERRRETPAGAMTARTRGKYNLSAYEEFCRSFLTDPERWIRAEGLYMQKDALWLMPEAGEMAFRLHDLHVLRGGLCLGHLRRDRFEPDHAWAMALTPGDVRYSVSFSGDGQQAAAWLHGETVPAENLPKGWTLVCADGFSMGWGKSSGKMLKNHYPRGLRTMY